MAKSCRTCKYFVEKRFHISVYNILRKCGLSGAILFDYEPCDKWELSVANQRTEHDAHNERESKKGVTYKEKVKE